ncbi:MAG: hypothetical protein PHI72_09205 [Atribacterota bacterium]|nr:hypothetical protein [Atribacterota bacterium]MDD4896755.1 hypothetical protein [Atribacterota bacterium]MDD5637805.1 hypothetical protein [Atribacterota bacterium]
MLGFLKNRNFILPLAFVMGLFLPDLAQYTKSLTIPALALVMTVSLSDISTKDMLQWKQLSRPLLMGILMNYLLLSSLIILLTFLFIPDAKLRIGMIMVAAAPPGVAIIPFSAILSGNVLLSLFATFGAYLSAIIITPTLLLLLTEAQNFPVSQLIFNLFYLIILPIIFSRILQQERILLFLKSWKGTIVNWGFFIVISTVIGLNQVSFFQNYHNLIMISLIALLTTFPLFYLLQLIFKKLNLKESEAISMILLGTIKNGGFAAALAITLFDQAVSIPGAIISAVYALYMIWLGR